MARPSKSGVDYFPHDVDASSKKTLFTIESRFGNNGYAFWFKLLELLGQQENLFLDVNDESNFLFLQSRCHVTETEANEILQTLSKLGAIDSELWKIKIIWSENYVHRLTPVFLKRRVSVPEKPLTSSFCDRNTHINPVSVDNGSVSVAKSTQSRVKESRVNKNTYGEFANVFLTDEEYEKLKKEFPDYQQRIENLSAGIASKGYKYKSHYATIKSWARKNGNQPAQSLPTTGRFKDIGEMMRENDERLRQDRTLQSVAMGKQQVLDSEQMFIPDVLERAK